MDDWQPIETAPKDRTIRVKNEQMRQTVQAEYGVYHSALTGKDYPDNWVVVKEEGPYPTGLRGHFVIPTHWQEI